ncbi:MAG: pyruvate synthase subunit beta [Proteobacteria bacterium]|nr:pyruvate synthase subunit beta [Pseudomonadota bacterium]
MNSDTIKTNVNPLPEYSSCSTCGINNEPMLDGNMQREGDRNEPILRPGNTNCGGCGMSVILNWLSLAAGSETRLQMVIPACCGIVTPGKFPNSAYGLPVVASTFASAAAVGTGLAHTAELNNDNTRVICFAGDGGTYDIGMATLSAAAERNEDLLYICYDNEIYGNTGGQRSSATPLGAVTTTTQFGKDVNKKDIVAIMSAHRIPYTASLSIAHPNDSLAKLKKALAMKGFRFLHVLSPCPTGWKSEPSEGIELVRKSVKSGLFPIIEIENDEVGETLTINIEPEMCEESLRTYFESQGRFKRGVDIPEITRGIERNWKSLRLRAGK